MPELPEVETVVRGIRPKLVGRTIRGGRVLWARTVGGKSAPFLRSVDGARVERVWRRAKYFVLDLSRAGEPAGHLLGHLRMSGRVHVERRRFDGEAHLRVELDLDDRSRFAFIDVRKFGRLLFVERLAAKLGGLGPEPLDDAFSADAFAGSLRARQRSLKPLLLDQTFVAGLGNIYVDESLFEAGLHPLMHAARVDRAAAERLHGAIRATLAAAIAREGSSFDAFYRTPDGNPGGYQSEFKVYDRAGEPCVRCGTPIERIVVGQRGTHLCPTCQRKPRARRKRQLG